MAVRKIYRSVVAIRREAAQEGAATRCDHNHYTPEAATSCLVARVREAVRHAPLLGVIARIDYTHSRHDWFPL